MMQTGQMEASHPLAPIFCLPKHARAFKSKLFTFTKSRTCGLYSLAIFAKAGIQRSWIRAILYKAAVAGGGGSKWKERKKNAMTTRRQIWRIYRGLVENLRGRSHPRHRCTFNNACHREFPIATRIVFRLSDYWLSPCTGLRKWIY